MPFIDNQVTRFPDGVTNVGTSEITNSLKTFDPTLYHMYFEDFDYYVAGDWTVTETGTATQALTDADGGVLLITNSAADNDASFSQKVGESFLLETGKKLFFKALFAVSDATESDVVIGLQITDTAPLDVTDGIYFLKPDGQATFDFIVRQDATTGSESEEDVGTLEDGEFMEVSFFYDGIDRVYYGVDGSVLGYLTATTSTFLPNTELTISFGVQNGEAVAKTMSVDYIFVAKER